ncbi:MAG: ATP-binding domain-containing protein [Lachnospiraceae bacterium]|nr:ATP-binding domain-containing protein [Lachnospiraceae bacterium]
MSENSTTEHRERQKEEVHLRACRALIAANISEYEQQYEERHRETKELFDAVQSGNVELYDQMMTSKSLEEHSLNQLNKNQSAYDKPFFGRIDYRNMEERLFESIYIGKHGILRDKVDVEIVDWRAPISSVYYENEIGEGTYSIPDSHRDGGGRVYHIDLNLKRTYDIEEGRLQGFYDSDVAANDELLVKYLSKNRDAVLGDIIATIQKEQNEIIRESPFHNILVQGVAGSGKTTVAMHRISYIMYNYKERFTSNEFCIVGGSDILIDYITGGLPELDVYDVKHMRMDELLARLLKREWKKKYKIVPPAPNLAWKSKMLFASELEQHLQRLRDHILGNCVVCDEDIGMLLSQKNNDNFIRGNPEYSINRLLVTLDERLRARIKLQCQGREEIGIYPKKLAQYKNYFSNHCYKGSVVSLYLQFLEVYGKAYYIDMAPVAERIARGVFDVYDMAAMLIIYYRTLQRRPDEEFGQMFIDEAQDFGPIVYYALRTVLPECYFTIMGDVSQNVNYECGMNEWHDMRQKIFCGANDSFRVLAKSYRNTIEISDFAGKILSSASKGAYKIQPVIRHGEPVHFVESISLEEAAGMSVDIVRDMQQKGYETIAVICFSDREKEEAVRRLSRQIPLTDSDKSGFCKGVMALTVPETKGLEFDCVLLWKPDLQGYRDNPKLAKLLYVAATRALHELFVVR